ncbi:Hypothetical predicted protein [Paramuricea clavata]|uniref:RNA-directed DNA polymerase n=1 Tax=Paramuricea clavata TaxID=317549 RepID=A0A6S7IHL7_PARCT|nr:Hypothetical predicted protein [Paramuricea clavata]
MASAENLQPMPPFDPKMDISAVAQRWEQWLKRFQRYLLAMDIKLKARQRAMLLYAAGPEVEAIFDTLPDNGYEDDFKTACEKLTEYFCPSKNVPFEVYKFRQAKQQEHETLDAYYTRLCTLAKTCEFADTDTGTLLNHETAKRNSETTKQRNETAKQHFYISLTKKTKEIIKKDISDGNEEYNNQLQHDHRRPRTTIKYSSSSSKKCFKCGLGFPHKDNQKCPAVDKECYKYHKRGHFARVCKTTGGATSSFKRVNKVDERHSSTHKSTRNSSSDSDSGSELMFIVQQAQQSKHPYSTVRVNGVPMKMMVDSGGSVNVLGPEEFEHLSKQSKELISLKKSNTKIRAFGENNPNPRSLLGKVETLVESKHCMTVATIYITASQYGKLLSNTTAQQLGLIKFDLNSVSQQAVQEGDLDRRALRQTTTQVEIPTTTINSTNSNGEKRTKVCTSTPDTGRVSTLLEEYADVFEGLEKWLQESQDNDLIEPVVNKSTEVNEAIKREHHPMPTIEELTDDMSNAAHFTRLDLRSGYHQIVLNEESRGLVNYCSKFIPNFSTITAPLRKLDRKKVQWTWDTSHQEAFHQVKSSLSEQCTLAYYDPNRSTSVVVDASPVGLGDMLVEHDEQGILKVIAFASRALTLVEQRYCQTEREALACVWACEKFHLYLVGCQFSLYTDHQALEILYSAKAKQSARIQRWALRLQQYNYTVKYRPGTGNPANSLSWAPINSYRDSLLPKNILTL